MQARPSLQWDLFCRVVDNFGDAGVCWRLACALAERGQRVRLVIDDAAPLAWMAPQGAADVEVLGWPGPDTPGDVVVEAFGCDPPPAFVKHMVAAARPPVWINLEYLSAEPFVERSHGLPSPQPGGLTKWFFYPGFTPATGGLLREAALLQARADFDRDAWLRDRGLHWRPGERVVSLFCYEQAQLPAWLDQLSAQPTLLLLTQGHAQRQVRQAPPGVRLAALPWLSQADFDRLLWASDINFVRGEDSLVRAIWAGAPFAWQAYPQHDGAHHAKVDAMLAQMRAPPDVVAFWRAWNGATVATLPETAAWRQAVQDWRSRLLQQADLATQLHEFASGTATGASTRSC